MFSVLYDFIAKFILLRKYYLVIIWYLDIRHSKRIIDFKDWLLKKRGYIINKNEIIEKKKSKILSFIRFRFNLLKNIQQGMNLFFAHNNKYVAKDFEYLDIFHSDTINNNESIGEIIVWKKKIWSLFQNFSNHLSYLKTLYFNKRLWAAYRLVKRKYFKNEHFQFKFFSDNYWATNIKIDRFYKTHLKWTYIKNSIAPKFYKFFIIYNFLKFRKLSTKRFPKDILNSVFFKLVLDQILPQNLNFDITFRKNNIKYQKTFSFFSFENLYKSYNVSGKIDVLFRSLYLLNQKNWSYWSDWKKKNFLDSIKYYQYLKNIKNFGIHNIKQLEQYLYSINLYFTSYRSKNISYYTKFFQTYSKLIFLYMKYSKFHKQIFPSKYYLVSYDRTTDFIYKIKYNFFIKNILALIKKNIDINLWESNKFNLFIFLHLFLQTTKFTLNYFNKFFNLFFLNIFLNIFKKIFNGINSDNKTYNTPSSVLKILKDIRIDKNITNNKQQELYFLIKSFLRKKKKISHFINNSEKKKKISLFDNYSSYQFNINKHPFYNIIKYEYNLYLKKNPYKNDSIKYFYYINFNKFIEWKRKNIVNNIHWKIFYKYSPNNKVDFFKDLFVRYKSFLKKKFVHSIEYNTLFYISEKKNIIKDPKYYLGWFIFNQPVKLKNWFYQKDFFLFPNWFYNYEKEKSPFLNFDYETFQKEMKEIESKLFIDIRNSIIYSKNYKKFFNINKNKTFLKSMLNFYRIAANNKIYKNFKKDLLIEKLIYIDRSLTLKQKDNIINKIRFHKFIKWNDKKRFISSLENRFDHALTFDQKKMIIKAIFDTERYNFEEKKKIINKKIIYWNKLNKLHILRQKRIKKYLINHSDDETIIAYHNIINSNNSTHIKKKIYFIDKAKGITIDRNIISHYSLFNRIYENKLLNNLKISSSLNNLFYKFYNIPQIFNYNKIRKYFINYKIRSREIIYNRGNTTDIDFKTNNDIVLNKNFTSNIVIDLSKFIKMYGFRWW